MFQGLNTENAVELGVWIFVVVIEVGNEHYQRTLPIGSDTMLNDIEFGIEDEFLETCYIEPIK